MSIYSIVILNFLCLCSLVTHGLAVDSGMTHIWNEPRHSAEVTHIDDHEDALIQLKPASAVHQDGRLADIASVHFPAFSCIQAPLLPPPKSV